MIVLLTEHLCVKPHFFHLSGIGAVMVDALVDVLVYNGQIYEPL